MQVRQTGAPNVGRLVDRPTVLFLKKTPLHGAVLTSTERLRNDKDDLVLSRTAGAGEDATEVAPPATFCVKDCQAQNQVGGGAVVLGHPASVPSAFRLEPRTP